MKFGWRIIKTGIAVGLCVLAAHLLRFEYPFYSAIAAVIALQATIADTFKQGVNRMKGTFVGAVFGYLFALVSVNNPVWIGLGVIFTFTVLNYLRWREAMNIAAVVFIAITLNLSGKPFDYSLNRLLDTALGILIAFMVNRLIFPPKYREQVEESFEEARRKVIEAYRLAFRSIVSLDKPISAEILRELEETIQRSKKLVILKRKEHLWGKEDETFRLSYVEPQNRLERMAFAINQINLSRNGWVRPFSNEFERDVVKLSAQSFYLLSLITDPQASVVPGIYQETSELIENVQNRVQGDQQGEYVGGNKGQILELLHWVGEITKASGGCLGI